MSVGEVERASAGSSVAIGSDGRPRTGRVPLLYLAPWVDYGGSDKGTIDWFRWLDRDRFAPSLITTQPSPNRRLAEVESFAEELWALPELMEGEAVPRFVFDFIDSRGVELLHVMNARLAFELLPDLASLPRPPRVVVQLHVEEQTRDGYVRYVTTRYGNLVDAFSVTSEHLAAAVEGYGVARERIHVIHTGVDGEGEFSPSRVVPVEGLERDVVHILYPGRLCEQKDPMLMVNVAAALHATGDAFRIHVVGDGELEQPVRAAVAARGLDRHVSFHPPTREIARWYAACDVLLMTSVFEGVPYVVFEAMAMGLPVVAPALPGNVELLGGEGGALVEPRDDVAAYAEALRTLVRDGGRRRRVGADSRRRMLEGFSLQQMAAAHGRLYDGLLAAPAPEVSADAVASPAPEQAPEPIRLRTRPPRGTPLVSAIVPCFNHGRYLRECLASIERQTYPAVETIVIDDGSTEAETLALLAELEHSGGVRVIRQPHNAGPSAARNAGIDAAAGRYVLPVDADNILLDDAVEQLVAQLQSAGEQVGFVYPNLQFFGNRDDYFEPPEYDLHALLYGNFCDTSSLFDRELFDAGLRFDERIVLGHEDWDFALDLAERGVYGQRARAKTLLYRKHGFTRSDMVEHGPEAFHETVCERHPALYGQRRDRHPFATIKAGWSPELSILALRELDRALQPWTDPLRSLRRQSCRDLELIAFCSQEWALAEDDPALRRLPAALASTPAQRLDVALQAAKGRVVVATTGDGSELLSAADGVEKMLRLLTGAGSPAAIAFAEGAQGGHSWRPIASGERLARAPHAIAWRQEEVQRLGGPVLVDGGAEIESLARALIAQGGVLDWRHMSAPPAAHDELPGSTPVELRRRESSRAAHPRARPPLWPAAMPSAGSVPRRWDHAPTWMPPLSQVLCRHHEIGSERRIVSNEWHAPPGHYREHVLGAIRTLPFPGTACLLALGDDEGYGTIAAGEQDPPGAQWLGHLEQVAFPLLEAVVLARHPETGQRMLLTGEDDPLLGIVEPIGVLGFIERFPLQPREAETGTHVLGLVGLTRAVDRQHRRHRVAVGALAPGTPAGELGALLERPHAGAVPLWVSPDGFVQTDGHRVAPGRPSPKEAVRWTLAPLHWRGPWSATPRARATARRALDAAAAVLRGSDRVPSTPQEAPSGYLFRDPGPARIALYAAVHPVVADQLLTTHPREAIDMGYRDVTLLGYIAAQAPVTGELGPRAAEVPWASRFGLDAARA